MKPSFMKSKVVLFLICSSILTGIIACDKQQGDNHIIPYVPVRLEIELYKADYSELKKEYSPIYFSHNQNGNPLGYLDNGVIVMSAFNEYVCYDATCTRCLAPQAIVEVFKDNSIGTCKACKTEFLLLTGQPLNKENEDNASDNNKAQSNSGEKIYPLKSYPASKRGEVVVVSN
ncbi:hypothetical protein FACS1894195_2880 [Bacteroidia bacterium]|nr:hypothetical protein FACS1894195_2880 [Bacteroidia bacterium]